MDNALQELRSTLGKMEVALGHISEAVVWTDESGAVQWCNRVFDQLVARSHIAILGLDLIDLLPFEENDRILPREDHPISIILSDRMNLTSYYRLETTKGKTLLHVSGRYIEFHNAGGSALLSIRDVTRDKESEQIRLQNLALNAAANGIVITDNTGKVKWINRAFIELTGYVLADVYNRSLKILGSDRTDRAVIDRMQRTIYAGEVWSGRLINRRKNGEYYTEYQTIMPVISPGGEITHFISIKQDITEKEHTASRLSLSESRMHAILETAADGIITINERGIIESLNPAAESIFGYSSEEVIGRNINVLMPEPYHSQHGRYIENYLNTRQARVIGIGREATGRRADGSVFPLELAVSEIKSDQGRLFTGILRDISARKKTEEELVRAKQQAEAANKAKSIFLAGISHEIRTPLNAVIGLADALKETDLSEEQLGYVRVLASAGENLYDLINDVLDYSKIEAGHIVLAQNDFLLREEIKKACAPFSLAAKRKGLDFEWDLDPTLPETIQGDSFRLRQVLSNLLGNAVKFTAGGEIHLAVGWPSIDQVRKADNERSPSQATLLFSVSDTGIGIAAGRQEAIFDRFSQADETITDKFGGTGLGLAISRQLVEMMGGRIWVDSRPGRGSIFYFIAGFGYSTLTNNQMPPEESAGGPDNLKPGRRG